MKASKLMDFLIELENDLKHNNRTLDDVDVNFRYSDNDDVYRIGFIEEDLFDAETNSIIESIILKVENEQRINTKIG